MLGRRLALVALLPFGAVGAGACGESHDLASSDAALDALSDGATTDMDQTSARVQATLGRIRNELATRSPGTELAIAFEDLQTGERLAIDGDVLHVSASSAKAWWVAAALDAGTVADCEPDAVPVFETSDNSAAGRIIDRIGPDAVNTWMWNVAGMTSSALTQWSFDRTRVATNSPRAMGSDNYMTAGDAVTFLGRLYRREILVDDPADPASAGRGTKLLEWMTLTPDTGLGGWLSARLPASSQSTRHKGGWLPPGCCSDDAYYNTANEIGIVEVADRAYAISILARRGTDYWNAQVPLVEYASCEIYRAFARDDAHTCE